MSEIVCSLPISNLKSLSLSIPKMENSGLSLEAFEEKKAAGTLRHVGLTESMQMIAKRMGWQLEGTEDIRK